MKLLDIAENAEQDTRKDLPTKCREMVELFGISVPMIIVE